MTQEEKAKAYDDALKRAKECHIDGLSLHQPIKDIIEHIFPVLKESKDERIRNLIYCLIRDRSDNRKLLEHNGVSVDDALAYLEKQKEQNNAVLQNAFEKSKKDFSLEEKRQASDYAESILPTSVTYGESEDEYKLHKVIEAAYIAGQKEQKPVERYELGFKIGDEITDGNSTFKIADIQDEYYIADDGDKVCFYVAHRYYTTVQHWTTQKPAEWSENFEENIGRLLGDKLTWHSEDGSMSSTVFIDDRTLKDICAGIWFYVGKEALKYPNKELNVSEWSEEDEEHLDSIIESYKVLLKDYSANHDVDYIPYNTPVVTRTVLNDIAFLKSLPERFNLQPKQE